MLINWPGTDMFTTVTVSGLYDNNTESPLFAATGSTVPTSGVLVGGSDGTNFQPISVDNTGRVNVNASITPPSDNKVGPVVINGDGTGTQTYNIMTEGTSALTVQVVVAGGFNGLITFQASLDGTTYTAFNLYPVLPDGSPSVSSTAASGTWEAPIGGFRDFQVTQLVAGTTGTATIYMTAGQGQYSVVTVSPVAANFLATVSQGTSPWVNNLTQVAGVVLGATGVTAFGTAPAAANVQGVNASIFSGTTAITNTAGALNVNISSGSVTITGTVAVTQSTTPWVVAGNLTHNNAAPAANNVGVLPALANAASPTFTEGDQVLLSTNLSGALRVSTSAPSDTTATGAITSTQNVAVNTQGASTIGIKVTGTWTGTLDFEASADGTTWDALQVYPYSPWVGGTETTTANGQFTAPAGGYNMVRVVGNTVATGTATVWLEASEGVQTVYVKNLVTGDLNTNSHQATSPWTVAPDGTTWTLTGTSANVDVTNTVTTTVSGTVAVVGTLTNNNAAPGATNIGVLPAIAASGTFDAPTPQAYTAGDLVLPAVSKGGSSAVIPADELYASHLDYYAVDTGNAYAPNLANNVITPLVSIRSSSAAFKFLVRSLSTFTDGSQCVFRLYKNPTLTGATFAATPPTGSHVTFDTAATAVTAGQVVWSTYSAANMRGIDETLYYLAAGTPGDIYTLAVEKFGLGTAKAAGALQWSEQSAAI